MKKILVFIAAIVACVVTCEASPIPLPENTLTVHQVYVSSYTGTAMPSTTQLMKSRSVVYLQNFDASYDIYCGTYTMTIADGTAFSVPTATFKILKGGELNKFDMRGFQLYCITEGSISKSTMSVIQAW